MAGGARSSPGGITFGNSYSTAGCSGNSCMTTLSTSKISARIFASFKSLGSSDRAMMAARTVRDVPEWTAPHSSCRHSNPSKCLS